MNVKVMSLPEKQIMSEFISESEPLPYAISNLHTEIGSTERVYNIPQEEKEKVLKELYPFADCPSMDDVLYDLHEEECFTVKDFMVIRWEGRNFLVSPYYLKSGGMVIDFIKPEDVESDEPIVYKAKQKVITKRIQKK